MPQLGHVLRLPVRDAERIDDATGPQRTYDRTRRPRSDGSAHDGELFERREHVDRRLRRNGTYARYRVRRTIGRQATVDDERLRTVACRNADGGLAIDRFANDGMSRGRERPREQRSQRRRVVGDDDAN